MHTVVETRPTCAMFGKTDGAEQEHIVSLVAADPTAGDLIVGTGGARKLRVAGRGKGKSGGYRVIRISPPRTFRCSSSPFMARAGKPI
jgi:hypothetical protein